MSEHASAGITFLNEHAEKYWPPEVIEKYKLLSEEEVNLGSLLGLLRTYAPHVVSSLHARRAGGKGTEERQKHT